MSRELILLHPYRLPSHHTLMLNGDDTATFLNGYLALWHPAALRGALGPPRVATPYDHETPASGALYAIPTTPPLFLPDDWEARLATAGAQSFRVTADRDETIANLLQAFPAEPGDEQRNGWFSAVGFGYLLLEAVFEAMDHLPQLVAEDFWNDVAHALQANDTAACRQHLQAAADRLRETREVLYPNVVFFADLWLMDDRPVEASLPLTANLGLPVNLIASGRWLERLASENPGERERLCAALQSDQVEVCSGPHSDREDALRPVESQLWNLHRGLEACRQVLGQDVRVFGRQRFAASPMTPGLLSAAGLYKAVLLPFDDGVVPTYRSAIIEWAGPDGKRVETFTRKPEPADQPGTFFHLAYSLGRTMLQDMTASLCFLHTAKPPASYHHDWMTLHTLAPVFGQFKTLTQFFGDVLAGEYPPAGRADEFHSCYLDARTAGQHQYPVSEFAILSRRRRRLESAWTVAGLYRGLSRQVDATPMASTLAGLEDRFERGEPEAEGALEASCQEIAGILAGRLLARVTGDQPGFLILNPCSVARRIAVELPGVRTPLPAPARATQFTAEGARVVVETPAFGFAWLPNQVAPGDKVIVPRGKPVEGRVLRNEFFEAEVDEQTGGLRVIRDRRRGGNRLGQQLVFGPGSSMQAKGIETTSNGPALGEIVSHGELVDGHGEVLASFHQRLRCWWGRPILEIHIELEPMIPPTGYPWHAAYAARFAWRDDKAHLFRGVNLVSFSTTHTRPESPDWFEIRSGSERTALLTGGLPFLQRQGTRMVDVILLPEGETHRTFELGLVLDDEDPAQAAVDFVTPGVVLSVRAGPPHVGTTGWLLHVDASNIVVTSIRPVATGSDAIVVRLLETRNVGVQVELRCIRPPTRAVQLDERDMELGEASVSGDAVGLYLAAGEMQRVRIEFGG